MFADSRFDYLGRVRYYIAIVVTPLHLVADLPSRTSDAFHNFFKTRTELETDNQRLQDEMLMLQFKLQKLDHLEAENQRLNELLKASSSFDDVAVRAQLVGESPDPFSKRVWINKGGNEGVFIGQPVVDAYGLMGQVVQVEPLTSWVLLITDPLHATPVQVNRNGVRAIAAGTPDMLNQLTLENVSITADIQVGDVLVTSGLDQKFPAGYRVGVVSSVKNDAGQSFANIRVTPTAQLDRSRNVLLLFSSAESKAARASSKNATSDLAAEPGSGQPTTVPVDAATTSAAVVKPALENTQPSTPRVEGRQ